MEKLKKVLGKIEPVDDSLDKETQKRLDNLTKPPHSLGRLEELAKAVVRITRKRTPVINNRVIFTMAGDHGVTEEGVSAYPKVVTAQMVYNFLNGQAAINVLARHIGAKVVVVDMGVAERINIPNTEIDNFKDKKISYGTKNIARSPAMTRDDAIKAIEAGIESLEEELEKGKIDIVGTGDMGIGNTTPSTAITAVITGRPVEEVTGRGTGIDDKMLKHKIEIIKKAIEINRPNTEDAIDILSKLGGFEIGGLVGIILKAASEKIPVVIDGLISGTAHLIAYKLSGSIKGYTIAAHRSYERGHSAILNYIGVVPLLELELRLGEGTGAALGMSIVEAAVRILNEMATFKSASVSKGLLQR